AVVGELEIPAVRVFGAASEDGRFPELGRVNPGGEGEVALADVDGIPARDHDGIGGAGEGHRFAEWGVDEFGFALEGAGQLAMQRPRSGETFGEARRVGGR